MACGHCPQTRRPFLWGAGCPSPLATYPDGRIWTSTPKQSACALKPRAVPIRSCSRWGLPCRQRCRRRGALLPHRFTLAAADATQRYSTQRNAPWRSVLCGTIPRLAPAGRYPAPLVHGARTFLPGNLSVLPERPSDRLTPTGMGRAAAAVKRRPRASAPRRGREPPWS